jgi:hypothetical protein
MCKILYPQQVWNIEKKIIFHKGGMLKFTYKGSFLTIKHLKKLSIGYFE